MFLFYHANIQIFYNRWSQLHHHCTDLEGDEDDEVGQVQREDLAAGGGSGDDLESCLQQGGALCSCQSWEWKHIFNILFDESSNEISN